jgi:anti-sigma factor RsiW
LTCERYIELISSAIDGELTDSEASDLDIHVQECPACRARSALMRRQNDVMRSTPVPVGPVGLRDAVRRRIGLAAIESRRAVLHVRHIPDRPDLPARSAEKRPTARPIMGPWGRA